MEFVLKTFGPYIETVKTFLKYSQGFFKRHSIAKSLSQSITNGFKDALTIRKKVSGNNYTSVLTLFKKQKDISKNSTAINVYSNKLDKTITTTSSNNTGYYKKDNKSIQVGNTDVKNAINDAINTIVDNIKLKRSSNAFNNTPTNKRDSKLYYKTKGRKFAINLGENIVEYDSYGDFIVKNGGFKTNVFADSEGKFIEKIPNSNYLSEVVLILVFIIK